MGEQPREGARSGYAEAAFVVAWLAFMLVTVTIRQGHEEFPGVTLLVFTLAAWAPLTVRTRWPLGVLVAVVVLESLHLALVPFLVPDLETPIAMGAYQPVPLATMAAAYTAVSRSPRMVGWIAGIAAATTLCLVGLVTRPHAYMATDLVMFNLVLIATGIGATVAARRVRRDYERMMYAEQTQREVTAERLRIARELHDVLAHNLTLVNAQASVASYLMSTDPEAAAAALRNITVHTRGALDELRATVGLLRHEEGASAGLGGADDAGQRPADGPGGPGGSGADGGAVAGAPSGDAGGAGREAPAPGLARLGDLVASFRSAGTRVDLEATGEVRPLSALADLAVYRIVQEAMTNAVKHAPGARVGVALTWTAATVRVRVANDPSPLAPATHRGPGTGHGLIGMRERAQTADGTFAVERPPTGGFVVVATVPVLPPALTDPAAPPATSAASSPATSPATSTPDRETSS